jgi:hypothetical protein
MRRVITTCLLFFIFVFRAEPQTQLTQSCYSFQQAIGGTTESILVEISLDANMANVEIHWTSVTGSIEKKVTTDFTAKTENGKIFITADALAFYRKETGQSANKKSVGDETWILRDNQLVINEKIFLLTECKH